MFHLCKKNTKREIATVLSVLLANKEHKKAGNETGQRFNWIPGNCSKSRHKLNLLEAPWNKTIQLERVLRPPKSLAFFPDSMISIILQSLSLRTPRIAEIIWLYFNKKVFKSTQRWSSLALEPRLRNSTKHTNQSLITCSFYTASKAGSKSLPRACCHRKLGRMAMHVRTACIATGLR